MTDHEWFELLKQADDEAWHRVWDEVVEPESTSMRSADLMQRYSLTAGDLMGMLYEEMMARGKINLYRDNGGSLQGWLRRYVRGYVLNADPNAHGEISIEGAHADSEDGPAEMEIPDPDHGVLRFETWRMTHLCFRDLWNEDPERAYIHLLKTRFHLTSEETKEFLDVSSAANVDQIFSRSVKFMREAWSFRDRHKGGNPA